MSHDPVLHLLGLARKAGRLEAGEEPAGAACRARQAKLLLLAADAAPNTCRRAAHFGEAGNVLWLETPFDKAELGFILGRSSCAMLALTDAGFAAAVYLRGIRYVQLPTTLLAAVDSSVGGKTAIDLRGGKNLAGAFLQPAAVLCDTDCLATLPPAVFADGAAEAVKTAVLADPGLFNSLEDGMIRLLDPAALIAGCVAYKAGVVERDEKEQGERKLLNLGHTIGHAIEKCSDFTIPHGHAVAAGLAIMARATENLGWLTDEAKQVFEGGRIESAVESLGLPSSTEYPPDALAGAALSDKKRSGDSITIVIPQEIGQCRLNSIPVGALLFTIRAGWRA